MIVPMRKIQLILHSSQWHTDIEAIQNLGLIDISYGAFNSNSENGKEFQIVSKSLDILNELDKKNRVSKFQNSGDLFHRTSAIEVARRIVDTYDEKQDVLRQISELNLLYKELTRVSESSSSSDVAYLAEHGLDVKIYKTAKKASSIVNDDIYTELLGKDDDFTYLAVCTDKDTKFKVPDSWIEFKLSDKSAEKILSDIDLLQKEIVASDEFLESQFEYANTLAVRKISLSNELSREIVFETSEKVEDQLLIIQGFCPVSNLATFNENADNHPWGVVISEPEEDDEVPTLLKNNKFINIIRPMFKLMDTIPGYKEFDVSAWFLLFISLFYAMIIGDAGYGSVMFIAVLISTLVAAKNGKASKVHALMLWFSFVTVIWGAITGNWFGYEAFGSIPFLNRWIYNDFSIANPESRNAVMLFCFRVGLVHLFLAHLWKALSLLRVSFMAVLHEFAQIAFLYGLYFVVLMLLFGAESNPLPAYALPVILYAFGAIIATSEQKKGQNFFVGVLKGVANLFTLFLGGVGALADIISYVRLFAVGLASLAIASAFNGMGLSIISAGLDSGGSTVVIVLLSIAGIAVIGLGHALNLAMALLAVMVHGVRLNMLEFGMHLGMEWSGRAFAPFKKNKFISLEEK